MFMIIINWLLSAFVIVVAAYILPGVHVQSFLTALIVALVLGILNAVVKPILILLTLPLTLLTLGLFTFVLNAILILVTASLIPGFSVDGFFWALIFSIVLSLLNTILHTLTKPAKAL